MKIEAPCPGSALDYMDALSGCILISVPLSLLVQRITCPKQKQTYMAVIGLIIIVIGCGYYTVLILLHALIGILFIYFQSPPKIGFIGNFSYRILLHSGSFLIPGFSYPHPVWTLVDAIDLILTLKMITVAYDIDEFREKHRQDSKNDTVQLTTAGPELKRFPEPWPLENNPTVYELFCYAIAFPTLTIGPFVRYRTYYDMVHLPEKVWEKIPTKIILGKKLLECAFFFVLMHFLKPYFGPAVAGKDELYTQTYFYRLNYSVGMALYSICAFTLVWGITECSCIACGLGVYPVSWKAIAGQGPTVSYSDSRFSDLEKSNETDFNSETVENLKVWKLLSATQARDCFRYWNCSVQWWLVAYVYRSDVAKNLPKLLKAELVMVVSALWHSSYGGHFMAFMFSVILFHAEDELFSTVKAKINNDYMKILYNVFHYFIIRLYATNYVMAPSLLKTYPISFKYFASTYFTLHIVTVVLIILCNVIKVFSKPQKSKTA